jgi:putative FmdB family regulatory protein
MPFYDYKCAVCGKSSQEIRPIAEMNIEKKCPETSCEGMMKKLLTVGKVISNNVPL